MVPILIEFLDSRQLTVDTDLNCQFIDMLIDSKIIIYNGFMCLNVKIFKN